MAHQPAEIPGREDQASEDDQARTGLEQATRERAYLLWERDGKPEGRAEEYWQRATEELHRSHAYTHWEQGEKP